MFSAKYAENILFFNTIIELLYIIWYIEVVKMCFKISQYMKMLRELLKITQSEIAKVDYVITP